MGKLIFFPIFVAINFAAPFLYGYLGYTVLAAAAWSAVMAWNNVYFAGWRAPGGGFVKSLLWGLCFSALVCLSIYFIGRWVS